MILMRILKDSAAKTKKTFKNANHQHLGKDDGFGSQRTMCLACKPGLLI